MSGTPDPPPLVKAFAFCPRCGAPREGERVNPLHCGACDYTHYFGPVTAVAGVVTDDAGRVLFLTRAREPHAGKLGLPGGFVDPGESAEEALRREAVEEVGLKLRGLRFLVSLPNDYAYSGVLIKTVDLFFACRAEGSIRADASEVAGWAFHDATPEVLARMAFESNRRAVEMSVRGG